MSRSMKGAYYRALREAGVTFDKHYRNYTMEDFKEAYEALPEDMQRPLVEKNPSPESYSVEDDEPEGAVLPVSQGETRVLTGEPVITENTVYSDEPLHKIAGLSDHTTGEVLRIDSNGVKWLQEEIPKSAIPKPRARLTKRYIESGSKSVQFEGADGYTETVEVAGDLNEEREVKVTLPSYQVGVAIYPQYPFRVVTYQGNEGFDYFDIVKFYGAEDLVPEGIKKLYVESVLCYDIRTTVREIQAEARRLQLGIPQEG